MYDELGVAGNIYSAGIRNEGERMGDSCNQVAVFATGFK
jgi:hypothetical protein